MRVWTMGGTAAVLGSLLALTAPASASVKPVKDTHHAKIAPHPKEVAIRSTAHETSHGVNTSHTINRANLHEAVLREPVRREIAARGTAKPEPRRTVKVAYRSYGGISCVPFARAASGIELKGNAANWWDAAAGVYARGSRPEAGAVMNFRATGRMRLGHVAVVTRVLSSRMVEIDHANWWGPGAGRGGVSRGIPVIDVSETNDWSEVRVGLGHSGDFGSVYPTYGFIYDRPDTGVMIANTPSRTQPATSYDEVAEAPDGSGAGFIDAPDHSIR